MNINLKQPEIVAALKQYVTSQGFNLVGKDVTITFTAGRKDAGTSAEIKIEDIEIPGGEVEQPVQAKPALAAVASIARDPVPAVVPVEAALAASEEAVAVIETAAADVAEEAPVAVAPVKTTSLFG